MSRPPDRVFELFDEFAAAYARGERPSLDDYLARAGEDAGELARLADAWLERAPAPPAREDSVELLDAFLAGEPGLVALRARRGLRVDDVVDALLGKLSLDVAKRDKVKRLYQQLEGGLLDPGRVSAKVWGVVRDVVGPAAEEAARWGGRPLAAEAVFSRADALYRTAAAAPPPLAKRAAPADEQPDEIDRLFGLA